MIRDRLILCKPSTASRVCITVSNSHNSPSCLDEASVTQKKVLYCFYKIFSKIIRQMKENAGLFTSRLKQSFLIHDHISYQPIKTRVWMKLLVI